MPTRYTLADQIHMRAQVTNRPGDTVVTLQHWTRQGGAGAVYVVCNDGVEVSRTFTPDAGDIAKLRAYFAQVRADHADGLLSEDAAVDEVVRRGGPKPRHCVRADCPSTIPIPFAAAHCAAGCDTDGRGRIEFLSVTQRRGAMTLVTGGKK